MAAVFDQFENVPLKQRLLALCLLLAALGVAFWYFLYQPKAKQIAVERTRLETLNNEVANLRAIEASNKEFQKMLADLKGQLDAARQQLPEEREIPKMLEEIAHFGRETGVEFLSFRPSAEVRRDFYNEVPMALSLHGPYHNIGLFLDKLSHYPRIISVTNLTMSKPEDKEGYLMLTSSCLATTYRYVEANN